MTSKKRRRIHIGDLVSSRDQEEHKDRLFFVTGEKRIGKLEVVGGLWEITDFSDRSYKDEAIGNFLSVWGVTSPAPGLARNGKKGQKKRI